VADIGGGEGVCNNNSSNTFPLGRFSRAAILISRMSRLESRCWDHFDCNGGSMRVWCGLWLKLTPDFMVKFTLNGRYHFPARDLVNLTFQIFPNSEVPEPELLWCYPFQLWWEKRWIGGNWSWWSWFVEKFWWGCRSGAQSQHIT